MISHALVSPRRVRSTFALILTLAFALCLITELAAQERGHRRARGDRPRAERGAPRPTARQDRARVQRWLKKLPEQRRQELVRKLESLTTEQRRNLIQTLANRSPEQRSEFLREHHRVHQRVSPGDAAETKRIHRRHEHFQKKRQEYRDSLSASEQQALDELPRQQQKRRFFRWLQRRKYVESLDAAGRARWDALGSAAQGQEVHTWMEKRKIRWRQAFRSHYLEQLSPAERTEFETLPKKEQGQRMHDWSRQHGWRHGWRRRGHRQRGHDDARHVRFRCSRMDHVKTLSPEAREEFFGLREDEQRKRVGKWRREQRRKDQDPRYQDRPHRDRPHRDRPDQGRDGPTPRGDRRSRR